MQPRDDPSWATYRTTRLVIRPAADAAVSCLVTEGFAPADRATLDAAGLPIAFAIVTPCNPKGRRRTRAGNARRLAAAQRRLGALGLRWWPGDGGSPDWTHVEPGFAIATDRATAQRLARDWKQSAFWWVEGTRVWLCGALVRVADEPMTAPVLESVRRVRRR